MTFLKQTQKDGQNFYRRWQRKIFHIKEISVAHLTKVVHREMANKVLGKKSEQKEAWEGIWNSACPVYVIDEKQTWGQGGGRKNNSHKVLIPIPLPSLDERS